MSYSVSKSHHSSLPHGRALSTADSFRNGSYGGHGMSSASRNGTLLRPRQSTFSPHGAAAATTGGQLPKHGRCPTGVSFISAIDTASTKLSIPITAVEPTLAFEDDGLVPGLCRLYLEGRCRQGDRCFQVHADPSVVAQLRSEAFTVPSCCPVHGAKCHLEGFPLGLAVVIDPPREREPAGGNDTKLDREGASAADSSSNGESGTPANESEVKDARERDIEHKAVIMLHNICPTRYLWARYEESGNMLLHVPKSKICREHRKGLCRFGDECSFLHLCRQIPLVGGEDDLPSHSRTLSRAPHGSVQDFMSHPPSFAASSNSMYHSRSQPQLMPQTSHVPMLGNVLLPHTSSFMDGSYGANTSGGRAYLSHGCAAGHSDNNDSSQPLLRPLGGMQALQAPAHARGLDPRSLSTHGSVPTRGSFSHNPYAEASSFQN